MSNVKTFRAKVAAGQCGECPWADPRPLATLTRCRPHADRINATNERRRARHVEDGMCSSCTSRKARRGSVKCQRCLDAIGAAAMTRRRSRRCECGDRIPFRRHRCRACRLAIADAVACERIDGMLCGDRKRPRAPAPGHRRCARHVLESRARARRVYAERHPQARRRARLSVDSVD